MTPWGDARDEPAVARPLSWRGMLAIVVLCLAMAFICYADDDTAMCGSAGSVPCWLERGKF